MNNVEYERKLNDNGAIVTLKFQRQTIEKDTITKIVTYREKLEVLEIIHCNLDKKAIENLQIFSNLKVLILENNNLKKIPVHTVKLKNLEVLDFSYNEIKEIPLKLFNLKKLKSLNFSYTKIDIEKLLSSLIKIELPLLEKLYLDGNGIKIFSSNLLNLRGLKELSLNDNHIKEIPENLPKLEKLKKLNLAFNPINSIPSSLLELDLDSLALANCPLLVIDELNNLSDIKELIKRLLDIQNQQIVKRLNLSGLGLSDVPYSLEKFLNLEELDLSDNSLKEFRGIDDEDKKIANFSKFKELKKLNLSKNPIEKISRSLLELTNLETLNLDGCHIVVLKEFYEKNRDAKTLISILLEIQDEKPIPLNEAKILVVGDGGVGKTSLVNRIMDKPFDLNQKTTLGIGILRFNLIEDIKVNIWDFAGQEITHQMHRNFLSDRSVYLLVINARNENRCNEISNWLEEIKDKAPNSPIIVVANHIDENLEYKIDEQYFKNKYNDSNLSFCYTSAKENIDIDELKKKLVLQIDRLPNSGDKLPKSWFDVKEALEEEYYKRENDDNILERRTFRKICKKHNVINSKNQDSLFDILKSIGTITDYFATENTALMNPSWVTNALYKIIRCPKKYINDGVLKVDDIENILQEEDNEEREEFNKNHQYESEDIELIVDSLIKAKIAFKRKDKNKELLIVPRINLLEPYEYSQDEYIQREDKRGLEWRYRYTTKFKQEFFLHFLIQMIEKNENSKDIEIKDYWLNGILVNYKTSKVLIRVEKPSIFIFFQTKEQDDREFLIIIRELFEDINREIKGVKEEIPLVLKDKSDNIKVVGCIQYNIIRELKNQGHNKLPFDTECGIKNLIVNDILKGYNEPEPLKPLIITEGKTDWKHLKQALKRLQFNGQYQDLDIEFDEFKKMSRGDSTIVNMIHSYGRGTQQRKCIFMLDRDNFNYVEEYGKKEFINIIDLGFKNELKEEIKRNCSSSNDVKRLEMALDNAEYKEIDNELKKILSNETYIEWSNSLNNNVYAFCIPKISSELDAICIEFYYKQDDLRTLNKRGRRLFFADEFEFNQNSNGDTSKRFISTCGKFKTDTDPFKDKNNKYRKRELTLVKKNVYSINDTECKKNLLLSKNDFAENIIENRFGFDNFDIRNFKLIFDVIEKILKETP